MCLFGRLFVGRLNAGKSGDHQKKKFFIYKPLEALIPLKEGYHGLLKLHAGCFSKEGANRAISKKITFDEACQDLFNSCISFEVGLKGCNEEKGRQQK